MGPYRQEQLEEKYKETLIRSNTYTDLEPVIDYMMDVMKEGKDGLPYLRRVESDLIEKGILPSRVEKWEDFSQSKVTTPHGRHIQYLIAISSGFFQK